MPGSLRRYELTPNWHPEHLIEPVASVIRTARCGTDAVEKFWDRFPQYAGIDCTVKQLPD